MAEPIIKEKDKKDLYFIALVPPDEIVGKVTAIKNYFAESFNSKAALRSPPHITLHMPFKWPDKKIDKLFKVMESFAGTQLAFQVQLKNYGAFPPRVIYIEVLPSKLLVDLQAELKDTFKKRLNIFNADRRNKPYNPHLTVAFRDLRASKFREAWPIFESKEFEATFTVDHIALLKHTSERWERYMTFPF